MARKRSVRDEGAENKARTDIRLALRITSLRYLERLTTAARERVSDDKDGINEVFRIAVEAAEQDGDVDFGEPLRKLAAIQLANNVPKSPWRDYILFVLCKPDPWRFWRDNWRDVLISLAVERAVEAGLKATRSRDQRYTNGAHSACSLVADELKALGLHLSEDAVEKIWRRVGKN
jgi:hypothetical protein